MVYVLFFVSYIAVLMLLLILGQLAVCKFLQVFAFSHYSGINEYLTAQLCFNFNLFFSLLISLVVLITESPNCHNEIIFWVGFEPPCDKVLFDNVALV